VKRVFFLLNAAFARTILDLFHVVKCICLVNNTGTDMDRLDEDCEQATACRWKAIDLVFGEYTAAQPARWWISQTKLLWSTQATQHSKTAEQSSGRNKNNL
jgi:hypothetical protein